MKERRSLLLGSVVPIVISGPDPLRSAVFFQIHNQFEQPIDVYHIIKTGNEVNVKGRLEECSVRNVPTIDS